VTRFVEKPWGGEEIFAQTDRYVGKILTVRAGHALSLQYHEVKDETMRVLDGTGELHMGRQPGGRDLEVVAMMPGSVHHISPGVIHRLVAVTDIRILEVSTPELDDVVRLDDRYGRKGTSAP
jgi:mannose-6-phosphate isomerase